MLSAITSVALSKLVEDVGVNLIADLAAHAILSLGQLVIAKDKQPATSQKSLRSAFEKDTSFAAIVQSIPKMLAAHEKTLNAKQVEGFNRFLFSPDLDALIRQIYAARLETSRDNQRLNTIKESFLASLSLYTGFPLDEVAAWGAELFGALEKACSKALDIAIEKGVLSAHEHKSAWRARIIRDEIAAVKKSLDFLTTQQEFDLETVLEFEAKYRRQIEQRHGHIIPPDINRTRKISIDKLYVTPNFGGGLIDAKETRGIDAVGYGGFLSSIYRAVLLGDPGGGKSTFSDKLSYDLAKHYDKRLLSGRHVTPIHVILRDYGKEKGEKNCSILEFIESTAKSRYQVEPPLGAFEYLLANGHAIVIFDGLDELLETRYRREISGDIENFCTVFPAVPIVVTSRQVGYDQAPLDEEMFNVYRLAPWNEAQVETYVENWFKVVGTDLNIEQRKEKVQGFLEESSIVPDLRANPLIRVDVHSISWSGLYPA